MEQNTTERPEAPLKQTNQAPKKKSKPFVVVLLLLIAGGGWFGVSKYIHGLHHEATDDAQIEANISPVIPRVAGFVKEIRVRDNQLVKKGDTLIILDDRGPCIETATGGGDLGRRSI
jgi:membrane fusion protein (multidrug efflux system)